MLTNKSVLVIGLARSGKAAIRLLEACNANITINVQEDKDQIEGYEHYIVRGIEVVYGGHPIRLFERDFDFVVKNPGVKYNLPFILRLKDRNIPIYTEIELAYRLAKPQNYIALTGTNGKTTTVHLLHDVYAKALPHVHLGGNVGKPLCDIVMDHNLLVESNHTVILEMSNFQLLDIDQFTPYSSSILNLTPDHLDYMETLEAYYESKTNIYKNQKDGFYILNLDDTTVVDYTNAIPYNCNTISYGYDQGDCFVRDHAIYFKDEKIIDLKDIKVVGKHNLYNIMTVICFAKGSGIDNSILYDVISSFRGVEHRIEFVLDNKGCLIYNDSKGTNVDATITALKAFDQPVILLLGGFDKGLDVRGLLPYMNHVKQLITFGDAGKRFKEDLNFSSSIYVNTLLDATKEAIALGNTGEVILLSPSTSSFDEFSSYDERGKKFKQYVKDVCL